MPIALILDTKAIAVWRLQAAQPEHHILIACTHALDSWGGLHAAQGERGCHISELSLPFCLSNRAPTALTR